MNRTILGISVLCSAMIAGCPFDVIRVTENPAALDSVNTCGDVFVLRAAAEVRPSGGYARTLNQGTTWECVGRIAQGTVYRTKDQVLTVEASNISEAYIVVSSRTLVGFYLPIEHAFAPVKTQVPLVVAEASNRPTSNR
jgi:hypothetical protein